MNIVNFIYNFSTYNYFKTKKEVNLPDEMWVQIIMELDPASIINCSMVSTQLRRIDEDERLWTDLAKKDQIKLSGEFSSKEELVCYHKIVRQYPNDHFLLQMAKAIGPLKFDKILTEPSPSLAPINYRNHIITLTCKDEITGDKVVMKIVASTKKGPVLYYSGLSPLLQKHEQSHLMTKAKIHDLSAPLLDYIGRLTSGCQCGLFLNDGEEHTQIPLTLA